MLFSGEIMLLVD